MTTDFTMHQYTRHKPTVGDENSEMYLSDVAGPIIIAPSYEWSNAGSLERIAEHIAMHRDNIGGISPRIQSMQYNGEKRSYVARLVWEDGLRPVHSEILKLYDVTKSRELHSHRTLTDRDIDNLYVPHLYDHKAMLPNGIGAVLMEDRSNYGRFTEFDTSEVKKLASLVKAAECLEFVHSTGSHGDVKINNFMGSGDQVRIIDLEGYQRPEIWQMTPEYASPEIMQLIGLHLKERNYKLTSDEAKALERIDDTYNAQANDVYSFGVVVQNVLSDKRMVRKHRRVNKNSEKFAQYLALAQNPHQVYIPSEYTGLTEALKAAHEIQPENRPSIFEMKRSLLDTLNGITGK